MCNWLVALGPPFTFFLFQIEGHPWASPGAMVLPGGAGAQIQARCMARHVMSCLSALTALFLNSVVVQVGESSGCPDDSSSVSSSLSPFPPGWGGASCPPSSLFLSQSQVCHPACSHCQLDGMCSFFTAYSAPLGAGTWVQAPATMCERRAEGRRQEWWSSVVHSHLLTAACQGAELQ